MIRERALAWLLAALGVLAAVLVAGDWFGDADRDRSSAALEADTRSELEVGSSTAPRAASSDASERGLVPNGATIRGRITEPQTGPLSEGRVSVVCLDAQHHASTTVGEDGSFELPACASGPSCVRLTHPSVEQPQAWEVESGTAELALEVELTPQISGTVYGFQKESVVPAAELLFIRGKGHVGTSSDAAGEYAVALPRLRPCDRCDRPTEDTCERAPDEAPSPVSVLVTAPGYATYPFEYAVDVDSPLDIVMPPPAAQLRGRLVGEDGEPITTRTRVIASSLERSHERHMAEVDERGRFAFGDLAHASDYSLRAIRDGQELATLALAQPGDEVELRSDLPARGVELTIELVDADAEPVVGARVDGGPFRAALSDAAGRVEASDVYPGRYTLRVRAGDCPVVREVVELESAAEPGLRRLRVDEC